MTNPVLARIDSVYQQVLRAEQEYYEQQERQLQEIEQARVALLSEWAAEALIDPVYLQQSKIHRVVFSAEKSELVWFLAVSDSYAVVYDNTCAKLVEYATDLEQKIYAGNTIHTVIYRYGPPNLFGLELTHTQAIEYLLAYYRHEVCRDSLKNLLEVNRSAEEEENSTGT